MEQQRSSSDVCSDGTSSLIWLPLNCYPSRGCTEKHTPSQKEKYRQGGFTETTDRPQDPLGCKVR